MAPPPIDRSGGGESTAGDSPRSLPTPFLTKTYQLVDDAGVDDVISWNDDGSGFVVWNPAEFARDLLPKYFKHNNFSSFVRQLNTYGFRKVMPDRWEFSNECFRKGEKKLLCDIQRRKIASSPCVTAASPARTVSPSDSSEEQVISSSNSPAAAAREFGGSAAELVGENERLRKQNERLSKELGQMKSLCKNIYVLMSNYGKDKSDSAVKPLDLLPMTRFCEEMRTAAVGEAVERGGEECSIRSAAEEITARLFGVPIGAKRRRGGEGGSADLQLQTPGGGVKSEPLDEDNSGESVAIGRSSWN